MSGTQGPFFNMTGVNAGDPATDTVNWTYLGGQFATSVPIPAHPQGTVFGTIPDPVLTFGSAVAVGSFTITNPTTYYSFGATMQNPLPYDLNSTVPAPNETLQVFLSTTAPGAGTPIAAFGLSCTMSNPNTSAGSSSGGPTWCTSILTPNGTIVPAGTYYFYMKLTGNVWDSTKTAYVGTPNFNVMGGNWALN
jgi:hypothetical protein